MIKPKKELQQNYVCNICQTPERNLPQMEPKCKCALERYRSRKDYEIAVANILLGYFTDTYCVNETEGVQVCKTCQKKQRKAAVMEISLCSCLLNCLIIKNVADIMKVNVMLQYWPENISCEGVVDTKNCNTCQTTQRMIPNMGSFCNCSLEYFVIDNEAFSKKAEVILECWSKYPKLEMDDHAQTCETCQTIIREVLQISGTYCKCSLERSNFQKKANIKMAENTLKYWSRSKSTWFISNEKSSQHNSAHSGSRFNTDVEMDSSIGTTYRARLGDFNYPMRKYRGFHLIFAQLEFNPRLKVDYRAGTEADVKNLDIAFQNFGFTNKIFWDLTKKEISQTLLKYSKMDHSTNDCIAITILTHGKVGRLYAKDGTFPAEELWKPFEANKCQSLAFRPKIIITQACRGRAETKKCELRPDGSGMIYISY